MKLLLISGSLRKGSLNTKLLQEAARLFGNAEIVEASLRMPLYDGDLEAQEGVPSEAALLAAQIAEADAVVMASPEYNQGVSGVLKNALDWVSRVEGNPWAGKPLALIHSAAGRTGGARANYALRLVMAPYQAKIIPGPEVLVAANYEAHNDDGTLKSARYVEALQSLMDQLREAV